MPLPFQRRPGAQLRPTFSRDFAGLKTLDHGVGPAIKFERASDATYFDANGVLQTAANDAPRFDHDPATAGNPSRGLLIEEARTNSYQRSAEFDNAYWTKGALLAFGSGSTANNHAAPDGTTTADTLIEDTTAATHEVTRTFTFVNGTTYTLSVFVKAAGRTWVGIRVIPAAYAGANRQAYFNLSDGTIGTTAASTTATIQALPNGWYRCSVTAAATVDGSGDTRIWMTTADNTASHTGDGTSGLHIWGAQLEAGAFPTSYIPTTTAAATRSADVATVSPVSSFYNAVEGTMFCEFVFAGLSASPDGVIWGFDDSSQAERIFQFVDGSSTPATVVTEGSSTRANLVTGSAVTAGQVNKFIAALKVDDYQAARNGTLGTPDTSGAFPTGINRLRFGRRRLSGSDTGFYNGHIRKIAYYPKRLSNTLLQQITT